MLKEHKNSKVKGTVGVGHAISYFTRMGVVVSIPLNDSQPYDLVIDLNGSLKRVQVKTTTSDTVALRTMCGNQSFHTTKHFEHTTSDFLYAMMDTGESWLIPTEAFTNGNSLKLTSKTYEKYKLTPS
jgi:hypothetical protein